MSTAKERYERYVVIRDERGLTDYKVSKETGIPRSSFSEWKNGGSEPKLPTYARLAHFFGMTVTDFTGE